MARHFFGNPRMLAVEAQSDIDTVGTFAGNHAIFPAEWDLPEMDVASIPWMSGTTQAGSQTPGLPGKRSAKLKLRFPVRGFQSNYTLGAVVSAFPGTCLLASAWGSLGTVSAANWLLATHCKTVVYKAAATTAAGSTAAVKLDGDPTDFVTTCEVVAGDFFAVATDINEPLSQFGWCKTAASSAPADGTVTLYEVSKNECPAGDAILASLTAFGSIQQGNTISFKLFNGVSSSDIVLVGCLCTGGEMTIEAGEIMWCTMDFEASDVYRVSGASGIAAVTNAWYLTPPANSQTNGRFTYGPSGTGSATTVQAWKDIKLTWTSKIEKLQNFAGIQGFGTPGICIPDFKLTAAIAWDSADTVTVQESPAGTGEHQLVTDWRNGAAVSICVSTGAAPGKMASLFMPALKHNKCPTFKASGEGGMMFGEVELVPSGFVGDGAGLAEPAPANSPCRFGQA